MNHDDKKEKELRQSLQRYFDHELPPNEQAEVEATLKVDENAANYLDALNEIHDRVVLAEEAIWEEGGENCEDAVTSLAKRVAAISSESFSPSLEEVAPLIERYADGEVDEWEIHYIQPLLDEREDLRDYYDSLKWTGAQVRFGINSLFDEEGNRETTVDFSGFWDGLSEKLYALKDPFDSFENNEEKEAYMCRVMSYYDGETPDDRSELELKEKAFSESLEAFHDVHDYVNMAASAIVDDLSFDSFYSQVNERLNLSAPAASVVTDAPHSGPRAEADSPLSRELNKTKPANDHFFTRYRQGIGGALAAILVMGIASLIYFALGGAKPTIIHKTVVVVEDVKYGPGISGEVINPIQQVSAKPDDLEASGNDEGEAPTVIWLYDDPKNKQGDSKINNVERSDKSDSKDKDVSENDKMKNDSKDVDSLNKKETRGPKRRAPGLSI